MHFGLILSEKNLNFIGNRTRDRIFPTNQIPFWFYFFLPLVSKAFKSYSGSTVVFDSNAFQTTIRKIQPKRFSWSHVLWYTKSKFLNKDLHGAVTKEPQETEEKSHWRLPPTIWKGCILPDVGLQKSWRKKPSASIPSWHSY